MPIKTITVGRQGNQCVPIPATEVTVSRQHCRITHNPDNTFTIENLSSAGTRVDGITCIKKTVNNPNARVQLGPKFTATVGQLLGLPTAPRNNPGAVGGPGPKGGQQQLTFRVSHLQGVWDSYQNAIAEVRARQKKITLVRSGLGMFTMLTVPCAMVFGPTAYILTGIGFIGNLYSFFGMKNDNTPEVLENIKDQFMDLYSCPNPSCGKTLPMMSYKQLRKNHRVCPHCRCKFVD